MPAFQLSSSEHMVWQQKMSRHTLLPVFHPCPPWNTLCLQTFPTGAESMETLMHCSLCEWITSGFLDSCIWQAYPINGLSIQIENWHRFFSALFETMGNRVWTISSVLFGNLSRLVDKHQPGQIHGLKLQHFLCSRAHGWGISCVCISSPIWFFMRQNDKRNLKWPQVKCFIITDENAEKQSGKCWLVVIDGLSESKHLSVLCLVIKWLSAIKMQMTWPWHRGKFLYVSTWAECALSS